MTTVTVNAQRDQVLRLLDAGDGYRFLSAAEPYLAACRDDHFVRLMMVREYLKLGLVGPARELVEVESAGLTLPAEFEEIRGPLAATRGGEGDQGGSLNRSWSEYEARFEANLAALQGRGIDVAQIRRCWEANAHRFELHRDNRGNDQVRWVDDGGWRRWIPCLGDHRAVADAQALPDDIRGNMPGPYLFEGIDLGWYFARMYEATRDTFLGFGCALFVVEPDPAMLAMVMHLHDWRELLSDRRVFWFVGPNCLERLRHAWDNDMDLPWPQRSFRLSAFRPACSPSALEVVREAGRGRDAAFNESHRELEVRYASRDVSYWARRFDEALSGREEPLRILAAVSKHTTFLQYSMRDAQRALEAMGHRCVVLSEKTNYQVTGAMTFHGAIRRLDPDLFFIIDHVRPEFESILPGNLPVLTWDQDCLPHVMTKAKLDRIAAHDFLVGCSKPRFLSYGYDPRQYLAAQVPACPEQFGGDALTEEERLRYTCDVSYVSHASQTPQAFHKAERSRHQDTRLTRLLDVMYEMLREHLPRHRVADGMLCTRVIDEGARRIGIEVRDEELRKHLAEWYLWRVADRVFRHEALEWVGRWARTTGRTFRIYGNGWERHATLAEFAAGAAQNGRELLCIHRASRINLQLMPAGFLHQRAMDGLASGGFFLSRATPSDLRGGALRRLGQRVGALGLRTRADILQSDDPQVLALLREAFGAELEWLDPQEESLAHNLVCCAELEAATEAFPRLPDVLFDSEEEFRTKAERFLADESLRRSVAGEMRQVVIERFSYRAAMQRFLAAMRDYLKELSGQSKCLPATMNEGEETDGRL